MKAKHIITTCGIILGGMAATGAASAIVTYKDSADVQFTFGSNLSITLDGNLTIANLTPGTYGNSGGVTATVTTNNPTGYKLSATVGNNTTYNTTDLTTSGSTARFAMMGSGTALTSGTWGYTIDNGETYGALAFYTAPSPTILKTTSGPTSGDSTTMKIGAYAAADQRPATYENVVNFAVVSNISTRSVTVSAGSGVASVSPSGVGSYGQGAEINITATCSSGYTFSNWSKSSDFGVITDPSSASTTYTVGAGNTVLTAYCTE